MDKIQLKKSSSILEFKIIDADGNETGDTLKFDVEDIELPLRLSQCIEEHEKHLKDIKSKFIIIDKKQDEKTKKGLSKKDIEKYNALKDFYKKEEEILDMFLGEGGCRKLLNGRNPYYTMFEDITEMLQPILPKITKTSDDIIQGIKDKYKVTEISEESMLKLDDQ